MPRWRQEASGTRQEVVLYILSPLAPCPLPPNLFNRFIIDLINRHPGHTPMVDGTFTQQTRRAIDRLPHNGMGAPKRRRRPPIGRPENRHDRHLKGRGNMHGTGIVRHEHFTAFHRRHQFTDSRCPGQDQRFRRQIRRNFLAQPLFAFGTKNDYADLLSTRQTNRMTEPIRDLGKSFGQPALSPAIGRAWIDPHHGIGGGDAALSESASHRLFLFRKNDEFRCRRITCEAQRLQEIPIITDLMDQRTAIRCRNWIGQ